VATRSSKHLFDKTGGHGVWLTFLRTPEPAVERGLANPVALARTGITGRATAFADPGVAVLVAINIATGASRKLRPATFERPICRWLGRPRHARNKEKNKENYRNSYELNSAQSHLDTSPF